jgi:hypothetical protein
MFLSFYKSQDVAEGTWEKPRRWRREWAKAVLERVRGVRGGGCRARWRRQADIMLYKYLFNSEVIRFSVNFLSIWQDFASSVELLLEFLLDSSSAGKGII